MNNKYTVKLTIITQQSSQSPPFSLPEGKRNRLLVVGPLLCGTSPASKFVSVQHQTVPSGKTEDILAKKSSCEAQALACIDLRKG